jgi:hypothetical protein
MANMSYCRFENTVLDLKDCYNNMTDSLDGYEFRARLNLLKLCKQIIEDYEDYEFNQEEEEDF